jgi:alpha-tubulin suppressor-like RCC1 family protein
MDTKRRKLSLTGALVLLATLQACFQLNNVVLGDEQPEGGTGTTGGNGTTGETTVTGGTSTVGGTGDAAFDTGTSGVTGATAPGVGTTGATNTTGGIMTSASTTAGADPDAAPTRAVQVAAGWVHTCALLSTGNVRCWGDSSYGQLGHGDTANIGDDEPPSARGDVPVGGPVTQIVAGQFHTCALLATGAVRCWGDATNGKLGYGNLKNIGDHEPAEAAGDVVVGDRVIQIAAGYGHTCALLATHRVRCWGRGERGQLGYANTNDIGDSEVPALAGDVDVGGMVEQIAAGGDATCALLSGGTVRCWGQGDQGQLGYGNTKNIGDDEPPSAAGDLNVGGVVTQIVVGHGHICARLENGALRCWGGNGAGQLGYGNTNTIGDDEVPASAGDVPVGGPVKWLALIGGAHTCAILETGSLRCWGWGVGGTLGYGNTNDVGDTETPAYAGDIDIGGTVDQAAAGDFHTCVVLTSGKVRCFGAGDHGELGYGNTHNIGDAELPVTAGDVPLF